MSDEKTDARAEFYKTARFFCGCHMQWEEGEGISMLCFDDDHAQPAPDAQESRSCTGTQDGTTKELSKMDVTFEQYVAAINALAAKDDALQADGTYYDAEAWRSFYDDGESPEDAWAEEKSCWGE